MLTKSIPGMVVKSTGNVVAKKIELMEIAWPEQLLMEIM